MDTVELLTVSDYAARNGNFEIFSLGGVPTSLSLSDSALLAFSRRDNCYTVWLDQIGLANERVGSRMVEHFLRVSREKYANYGPISAPQVLRLFADFVGHCSTSRHFVPVLNNLRLSVSVQVAVDLWHVDRSGPRVSWESFVDHIKVNYAKAMDGQLVLYGSTGVTAMMDAAAIVEGANIALPDAMERYKMEKAHAVTVSSVIASALDKVILERELGFKPIYQPGRKISQDHPVLCCLREVVRSDHSSMTNARQSPVRTLAIGATEREISEYYSNRAIHYYFSCREAKDVSRFSVRMLERALTVKLQKMTSSDKGILSKLQQANCFWATSGPTLGNYAKQVPRLSSAELMTMAKKIQTQTKSKASTGLQRGFEIYDQVKTVLEDKGLPEHFRFELKDYRVTRDPKDSFTRLLFEDVGYNFSVKDWLDIFAKTNAEVAYGYMALPYDLVFDNYPASDFYHYTESTSVSGLCPPVDCLPLDSAVEGDLTFAFMSGMHDNGYAHLKQRWSVLLRHPMLRDSKFDFAVEVALYSRRGPMVGFQLTRVRANAIVYRTLKLRENEEYLRLLDLHHMADELRHYGPRALAQPRRYFTVFREEFDTMVSYLYTLDIKSLNETNANSYVRAHINGVSLVSKELTRKWRLRMSDQAKFAAVVYHYVLSQRSKYGREVGELVKTISNWKAKLSIWFQKKKWDLLQPYEFLWSWLYDEGLVDSLVLEVDGCKYQWDSVKLKNVAAFDANVHMNIPSTSLSDPGHMPDDWNVEEWSKLSDSVKTAYMADKIGGVDPTVETVGASPLKAYLEEKPVIRNDQEFFEIYKAHSDWYRTHVKRGCETCAALDGELGDQILECYNPGSKEYTFDMPQGELDQFRNEIKFMSEAQDTKYRDTMKKIHPLLPKTAFTRTVKLHYIKGGPGTGKSYIIRKLADRTQDLVVAPFGKLRVDYQNQMVPGEARPVSWDFHTQHIALTVSGRRRIFVDEFTAYDWRLLAILVWRCNAEEVYLVGDEQQTGVVEAMQEGVLITNKVDLSVYPTHVPICNFRNPASDVKVVNHLFGTRMVPRAVGDTEMQFGSYEEDGRLKSALEVPNTVFMHYSHNAAADLLDVYDKDDKTSVRSNQGSTHENTVLVVTKHDRQLLLDEKVNLVALTRHKQQLTVLTPNSPDATATGFIERLKKAKQDTASIDYIWRSYLGVVVPATPYVMPLSDCAKLFLKIYKTTGGDYSDDADGVYVNTDAAFREQLLESFCLADVFSCSDIEAYRACLGRKNRCAFEAAAGSAGLTEWEAHSVILKSLSAADYLAWIFSPEEGLADLETLKMMLSGVGSYADLVDLSKPEEPRAVLFPTAYLRPTVYFDLIDGVGHFFHSLDFAEKVEFDEAKLISRFVCTFDDRWTLLEQSEPVPAEEVKSSQSVSEVSEPDCSNTSYSVDSESVVSVHSSESVNTLSASRHESFPAHDEQSESTPLLSASQHESSPAHDEQSELTHFADQLGGFMPNFSLFGQDLSHILGGAAPVRSGRAGILVRGPSTEQPAYHNQYGLRRTFYDFATSFVPHVYQTRVPLPEAVEYYQPRFYLQPMRDAYQLTKAMDLPPSSVDYQVQYLNQQHSNVVGSKFVSGELSLNAIAPLNNRGHPISKIVKYRSHTVGPALMYFGKDTWQELQVIQSRYLFRRAANAESGKRESLARTIAQRFVLECVKPGSLDAFSDQNLFSICERALLDMNIKNYQMQMDENFQPDARTCRFQLKDIAKPIKDPSVDLLKAGQGILAWPKVTHVKFMVAFRVINDLLLKALKPNVVYDNAMSEETFLSKVADAMEPVPEQALNGVIDATACDSGQNGFTQLIERYIYLGLGISETFLDWYFSYRQHYILQSKYVRASMQNVKTSGEPATLLGNSILMAALLNSIVRGTGPFCIIMKGDDGVKRQANMTYDSELVKLVKNFCPLDFKTDIGVPITFCGYALESGNLYPHIVRKWIKLVTHRFSDYKHYQEYQISLRDWLTRVPKSPEGYAKFLDVNASLTGRGCEDMHRLMEQIRSFSVLNETQFLDSFPQREFALSDAPTHTGVDGFAKDVVDTPFISDEMALLRGKAHVV